MPLTLCQPTVDVSPSRLLLSVKDDGIRHARVDAQLIENGRQLSAMMGLVVKEMNDRRSQRMGKFLLGIILVTERRVQPLRRDSGEELPISRSVLPRSRRSSSKLAYNS